MLQQQEHDTSPAGTAAQARVTPQELADAVAALQARKEAAAQQREGTIPIAEAVRELNLDVTAEEVWAEVEAQRATSRKTPLTLRQRLNRLLSVGAALIGCACLFAWVEAVPTPPDASPALEADAVAITVPGAMSPPAPAQVATPPVIRTLAEVPDNHPVSCTTATLLPLLHGHRVSPSRLLVHDGVYSDAATPFWTLVKHDGGLYLRGWISPMSDRALEVARVKLSWERTSDTRTGFDNTQQVTLKLGAFRLAGGDGNPYLLVDGIHPDSHARETW